MFAFKLQKQLSPQFEISLEFEANKNEITTLIGKSGAGKTTTLKLIAGLLPLDEGWIRSAEQEFTHMPVHLRKFAYVQQESLIFPHLNTWENLTYSRITDDLEEYIDVFELRPHLKKRAGELLAVRQGVYPSCEAW